MDINVDPYFSRPVRAARAVGIFASWSIWAVALLMAFTTVIPQLVILLIMVFGLLPYIISIQLVEPWLMRRVTRRQEAQDPSDPGDG